jgi:hypothetical protein
MSFLWNPAANSGAIYDGRLKLEQSLDVLLTLLSLLVTVRKHQEVNVMRTEIDPNCNAQN